MTTNGKERGSAIARALAIIEAVSKAERPLSPADLCYQLDIPKPSVHRLISQLEGDGYLQTSMRGLIVPGDRLHGMALGILYSSRFKALRQAILQKLTDEIGETCGIAIPNGTEMIYYDRVQTDWPLQIHLQVGSHTPSWCTASGKLYLSSITKDRRLRLINKLPLKQYTRNTITDANILEEELQGIKKIGIGTDNEEFVDGMVACAVPVYDAKGRLFACLFTHAPVIRKSLHELLHYVPTLAKAAKDLGRLIDEADGDSKNSD
ncbi:MAG: Pca regulon regulatory protein [Porticoccaceae bacterium UBA1117]|jgi:DNA-binding IclR family transcriptional regulator|nr:IclR family transcriptional regulator [Porticoccaceae bacterium]CAI8338769.1 MAG: Pca regulon regulatory protein [Porticoccaceae bacterium UBA1117]|tara:strand:- start:45 stop:836 length:792 start_codon:yes stop_codon:yes gene_type:complete